MYGWQKKILRVDLTAKTHAFVPVADQVYEEFLGEPNSHKAHELLHTHYIPRGL